MYPNLIQIPRSDVLSSPQDKHVGTPGIGAWIEMTADEVMKASAYMTDVLFSPEMGKSEAPEHAPLQVCHYLFFCGRAKFCMSSDGFQDQ